mmetsp:Transcript_88268/g.172642  ORF Transcript_88268/g.172642 Transcript_88268/m.172642 type:complete len:84 (+) Transcript_88268:39-290(+)
MRVARVEDPAERFGQIVRRIKDARNMLEDDVTGVLPVLDSKELDEDVAGALGGDTCIHHVDSRLIVTVKSKEESGEMVESQDH